ncbi:PepSY domain-containing protein [Granulicella sp. WH15]|uniref:PepSY domain-containing protein n=1 Tax=Granulicella sp. WH15 TaxID=2602070 RepID=UPI001366EA1B|nr:PepSY domain-containing protein [Granulicella sp. WH15]QHN04568.1 PepSY domain-containing protein [Granulicella sp. WH15]
MSRAILLKPARLFHLYSGVFLAPAMLFFAFTGFLQTFSFHETTKGSAYKPPAIFVELGQLHKKQTLVVPAAKMHAPDKPDAAANGKGHKPADAAPEAPAAPVKVHNLLPMKIFFGVAAVGLFLSTLTGLFMSYNYVRNKVAITATLLAGIVIPLLLSLF